MTTRTPSRGRARPRRRSRTSCSSAKTTSQRCCRGRWRDGTARLGDLVEAGAGAQGFLLSVDDDLLIKIVAGNAERVISGAGDRIYGRGAFEANMPAYGIFRQGKTYVDPDTGEFLGINADDVGSVEIVEIEGDIATMQLTRTTQEARIGDRLFPGEERAVNSTFMPSAPSTQVEGVILDVPRGVTQIGQFDVVTLNKGARDGLQDGNVLAVYKTGETVRDRVTGENVKIPDERSGLLMVFRTYDKLSYGLVLQATRSLSVKDKVRNP